MDMKLGLVTLFLVVCTATSLDTTPSPPAVEFETSAVREHILIGTNVTFVCKVKNRGHLFVSWLQDFAIMTVGEIPLVQSPRFVLDVSEDRNTYKLTVINVTKADETIYTCQVSTHPPTSQVNHLIVTIPPTVKRIGPPMIESALGSNHTFECRGTGSPQPTITWSHQPMNEKMKATVVGMEPKFVIAKLSPADAGTYTCVASNGVGDAVSANLSLTMQYAPVVSQSETRITSARGFEVSFECRFYANPSASVAWYRGSQMLVKRENIQAHGRLHSAVYRMESVRDTDFTGYTCVVKNDMGVQSANFILSGLPETPNITSNVNGDYASSYTLEWTLLSKEAITSQEILYQIINSTGLSEDWDAVDDRPSPTDLTFSYTFQHLLPDSQYAVKVRAQNYFGWSEYSDVTVFMTNAVGFTPPKSTTPSNYVVIGSRGGGDIVYVPENHGHHVTGVRLLWTFALTVAITAQMTLTS